MGWDYLDSIYELDLFQDTILSDIEFNNISPSAFDD